MITDEQILELAKTCGFDSFTPEDRVYWECWEEQLIEFARAIYEMGNDTLTVSQPTSTISYKQSINRVER